MKRIATLLCGAVMTLAAMAVPANPQPAVVSQPDGSQLTLRLCGDEFYHFNTTMDDYTIVQNIAGAWVYAVMNGNQLEASNVLARDAGKRSAAELALLESTPRHLTSIAAVEGSKRARAMVQGPAHIRTFDISQFRGLIILIQPKDTPMKVP